MGILDERNLQDEYKVLDFAVFPSQVKTVYVKDDAIYGGAHEYMLTDSLGFNDGKVQYVETCQFIRFVQKNPDGSMSAGIQSEQLAFVLLDRARKLNARFPSAQNEKMVAGAQMFLDACRERVEERMDRGVMGELKK